jgi:hypothetical protein
MPIVARCSSNSVTMPCHQPPSSPGFAPTIPIDAIGNPGLLRHHHLRPRHEALARGAAEDAASQGHEAQQIPQPAWPLAMFDELCAMPPRFETTS